MTTVKNAADVPVRKTITVNAPVDHAFAVFTAGFDTGGRALITSENRR
jgi:hypothetical protein